MQKEIDNLKYRKMYYERKEKSPELYLETVLINIFLYN